MLELALIQATRQQLSLVGLFRLPELTQFLPTSSVHVWRLDGHSRPIRHAGWVALLTTASSTCYQHGVQRASLHFKYSRTNLLAHGIHEFTISINSTKCVYFSLTNPPKNNRHTTTSGTSLFFIGLAYLVGGTSHFLVNLQRLYYRRSQEPHSICTNSQRSWSLEN